MGRYNFLVGCFIIMPFLSWSQNRTEVEILNSDGSKIHQEILQSTTAFLSATNLASASKKAIDWQGIAIRTEVKSRINNLWSTSPFRCLETKISLNILRVPGGKFQIRQIPINVFNGKELVPEELVINFSIDGQIDDIYFGIELHKYRDLIQQGQSVTDFRRRQMILDFLENFRTAYNRKDLDMIQMTFSDNALIIVGRVIEETDKGFDGLSTLGQKRVELIRFNKQQYMENLKLVFARNSFITINFDEIEIVKHGLNDEIYGVNLKQRWRSSTYGDEGYLFLMIDFENEEYPLIHVRAWQPTKDTPAEEVIELGDFDIIK
jgi:hypothetical protein